MKKTIQLFLAFVFVFNSANAQIITTVAGTSTGTFFVDAGNGGPATDAVLGGVHSIAINDSGIFIGSLNNTIRKINSAGIIFAFAGNDTAGFSGDDGPATAAKLNVPEGICFDKKGNTYIADAGNHRVRKVDETGIITTFAGNGMPGTFVGGGPATTAAIGGVFGVCSDAAGNIYISGNLHVLKVDTFGVITNFAGNGAGGFSGDGGPATNAGIGPIQIALDASGNLFIADGGSNRIRKIDAAGIITTVAGSSAGGTPAYLGDGGPATAAGLNYPTGVFPDDCGNVYISDCYNNRIRMVNDQGIITTIAGNGYGAGTSTTVTGGFSGDGGPATAAELHEPAFICIDPHTGLYITDGYNKRVRYIHYDSCRNTTGVPFVSTPKEELRIYPNPATTSITISNPTSINADRYSIKNLLGQIVLDGSMNNGTQNVDVGTLPSGSYIVSLYNEGNPCGNKMFVKN